MTCELWAVTGFVLSCDNGAEFTVWAPTQTYEFQVCSDHVGAACTLFLMDDPETHISVRRATQD